MTRRRKNNKTKTENIKETQENKPKIKYTPVQLEQTKLSKQLESYIKNLKQKELIVLFVANLHPRWKRLVEPVEYSFKNWEDAADVASYHCIRLSALLGSERNDASQLFTSQDSIDILQSGYFASETNPDVERHPRENSIQHLISPTLSISTAKKTTLSPTIVPTPIINVERKDKAKDKSREKEKGKERELEKAKDKEKTIEKEAKPVKKTEEKEVEKTEKLKQEVKKEAPESEKKKVSIESTQGERNVQAIEDIPKQQANTPKKSPKKASKEINKGNTVDHTGTSVCYKVPECYKDVNLMFLNLNVNGKDVKGLLSKLSWGCSAISLDCSRNLGLPIVTSDSYCINTEFGMVDSLGFVNLPIMHPADPNIKSVLTTHVLPLIYNGKVDLILGSDFFFKFKPTLNIRQRAIKFLDKEAPYFVHSLS
ncbi:unnamed protein product [Rhizopus stolonifer]